MAVNGNFEVHEKKPPLTRGNSSVSFFLSLFFSVQSKPWLNFINNWNLRRTSSTNKILLNTLASSTNCTNSRLWWFCFTATLRWNKVLPPLFCQSIQLQSLILKYMTHLLWCAYKLVPKLSSVVDMFIDSLKAANCSEKDLLSLVPILVALFEEYKNHFPKQFEAYLHSSSNPN